MPSEFSTKLLKGKEPLLRRVLCEVRFRDGQLYLDHTGRMLKKLVCDPSWIVSPDPTPKGTTVFHIVEGLQLSFSIHSASLDFDRSSSDEVIDVEATSRFVARAEETMGFVADQLEVTEYERLGFRQWYYFSFDSKEETEEWLRDIGLFSFSPALTTSFEAAPEAMGVSFVMQGEDRHYRIGLNGIERSAQFPMGDTSLNIRASAIPENQKEVLRAVLKQKRKNQINSSFAAVLDIDTYRSEPKELDINEFLWDCLKGNLERVRSSLPRESSKKDT